MSDMILHDDRDTIIAGLREQLRQAREELSAERAKGGQVERGAQALRTVLMPLYGALQHIFGETDAMGITEAPASRVAPQKSAVWEDWKRKLPSGEGKAIDALLLHGKLKTDQLRIHIGCASRTAQNIVVSLKSKGLIVKDGSYVSLKEV